MIADAGWANSSSDRSPGTTGAFLAATSEGGANRSRDARLGRLAAARAGVEAASSEADTCAAAGLRGWGRLATEAGRVLRLEPVRRGGRG